ncbi:MAG: ribonuclease HI [Dysgonamonadaceae bacterium]|jgi:ribonuclease HI|nr:ribonuclease HI [Dysgonamonadaceae bacterium]
MTEQKIYTEFPIILYTDGACVNNGYKNARGGFAYILLYESLKKEYWYSNFEQPTTNNRMELRGILFGLYKIKSRWTSPYPKIAVISDSRYCTQGASLWMYKWQRNGWKKNINSKVEGKHSLLNIDLWKEMFELCKILKPSFFWVKGHSGNKYNEICDSLAVTSISLRQEYSKNVRNSI